MDRQFLLKRETNDSIAMSQLFLLRHTTRPYLAKFVDEKGLPTLENLALLNGRQALHTSHCESHQIC